MHFFPWVFSHYPPVTLRVHSPLKHMIPRSLPPPSLHIPHHGLAKIKSVGFNPPCSWTLLSRPPEALCRCFCFASQWELHAQNFVAFSQQMSVWQQRSRIWWKISGVVSIGSTRSSSSVDNLLTHRCARVPLYNNLWELYFLCNPNKM